MQEFNQFQVRQRQQNENENENQNSQFVQAEANNLTYKMQLLITQINEKLILHERDGYKEIYLVIKAINNLEEEFEIHYCESTIERVLKQNQIIELNFIKQYKLHNNTTLITFATGGSLSLKLTENKIQNRLLELQQNRSKRQTKIEAFYQ